LADGTLLYQEIHPQTGRDLWTVSPDGKASPLRVTPFNEGFGQFSPGTGGQRWVAYSSDESGQNEIYVQSYPGGANRIAVSTGGGSLPPPLEIAVIGPKQSRLKQQSAYGMS
jgi:Tol biopolymer transport system component